jgi:hypothetical protein
LKQAAKVTGLSAHELRTGAKSGRYPHVRVGNSKRGKILFDIDLLNAHLKKSMEESVKTDEPQKTYGELRKIHG